MEYLEYELIEGSWKNSAFRVILMALIVIYGGEINTVYGQISTTPSSIYIGYEGGEIEDDTLFIWDQVRGHMRSGRFDAASSNFIDVGYFSQSFGNKNIASGESSFAVNEENIASGLGATAFGNENHAASGYSSVFGKGNQSYHYYETIVGRYNRVAVSAAVVPLFTVGGGANESSRKNAFIVTDDSLVGIGDIDPVSDLHIAHANVENAGLRIESTSSGNHWRFFAGTSVDNLALFHHSLIGVPVGVFDAAGSYGAPSDLRLKNSISKLQYGLATVLKLNPVSYNFNHITSGKKNIGFIAQEVIDIIPEAVNYNAEEDQYQMYYDSFGPIAIKAIQELNKVVVDQNEMIAQQHESIEILKTQLDLINKRLQKLD